jgi:hypothetical protein
MLRPARSDGGWSKSCLVLFSPRLGVTELMMENPGKETRDKILAEQAFEIYWSLGPERSLRKLWEKILEISREKGRDAVPTLHKPKLNQWYHRYNWAEKVRERERQNEEVRRRDVQVLREMFLERVALMTEPAAIALREIIEDRSDTKNQLKAIELLCQILGFLNRHPAKKEPERKQVQMPSVPVPEDADEVVLARLLLEQSREVT